MDSWENKIVWILRIDVFDGDFWPFFVVWEQIPAANTTSKQNFKKCVSKKYRVSSRTREALLLREDLMKSRQAERLAKQKLVEFTSSPDLFSVSKLLDPFSVSRKKIFQLTLPLVYFLEVQWSQGNNCRYRPECRSVDGWRGYSAVTGIRERKVINEFP